MLSGIGASYNITYVSTKNHRLPEHDRRAPFLWTTLMLRKKAITTWKGMNLHLVESPFWYEPLAFMTIHDNLEGLENALIGVVDFSMWAFLLIIFVCMRFSVVASLAAIESHSKTSSTLSLKQLFLSFISSGIYQKLRSHASKWKGSKCLLVNKWLWALGMSNLVSYAYKAGLTAYLTRTPEPVYPTDLQTVMSICNGQAHCIHTFDGTFGANRHVSKVTPALTQVLRRPNFRNTIPYFLRAQIKAFHNIAIRNSTEYAAPSALLDNIFLVEFVRDCMSLFLPEKIVSTSKVLSFNSFAPIYTSRPCFYQVIKKGLNYVYESGLYDQWQRNIEIRFKMYRLSVIFRELKFSIAGIPFANEKEKWLMYLLCGRCRSRGSRSKPLSLTDLSVVWITYTALLGSICGFLVFEAQRM